MGMRHAVAAAGLGAALVLGGATGALAQPPGYELIAGDATVSTTTVTPGGSITIGVGPDSFQPNSAVTVWFESTPQQIGSTTAASDGSASATVTIPSDAAPGEHTLYLSGLSNDPQPNAVSYAAAITVEGGATTPPTTGEPGLPATGAQIATVAGIGGALALTGIGIAFVSRRRRLADEE